MFVSTKLKILTDDTGAYVELPGLMTPAGVLMPLVDYFLACQHLSLPWMAKVVRSTQLFLEYLQANLQQRDSHLLFCNFAQRLYIGTFDLKTGLDPSGLCWSPRSSADARHIITDLSQFFEWMGKNNSVAARVNPFVEANSYDKTWLELAQQYRRDKALLGHLWSPTEIEIAERVRKVQPHSEPVVIHSEPPAFPEEQFNHLIEKGFKVGGRIDYRGILITLLLHGAGFRVSEPFNLYFQDVVVLEPKHKKDPAGPDSALVHIHHPAMGFSPPGWKDALGRPRKGTRAAYLAEEFGLAPRNQMMGTKRAGWKGGLHDGEYYKIARWFQPEYGEIFLDIWYKYLSQVVSVSPTTSTRTHPFAFINLTREPGGMYTIAQYLKAHAAACERIGLEVRKSLGTTPHGHRHAYGRRLSAAKIDKEHIQRFMHHASIESQNVYTQPTSSEILDSLQSAAEKLAHLVK